MDKACYKAALKQVDQILWEVWDPIGVNNEPLAFGEYSSYAPGIIHLLLQGASKERIYKHLAGIESGEMGIEASAENRRRAALMLLEVNLEGSAR